MFFFKKNKNLKAFLTGELVSIDKVNDDVFSQKMMGDGIAIKPNDDKIYSPCNGTVEVVFVITADIHHFDLAAFTFHFIVHAFLHQRCAKRADYPKSARFAMISYQSLRLSYLLNKTDCCLEQCPR